MLMLTNSRSLSTLRAALGQYTRRCIKVSPRLGRLPNQSTRLSSTSTPKLSNMFRPSVVNIGTASQITIPRIVYSTSWKGEDTEQLVYQAIAVGYRGIETGAEPLKYEEKLVGDGIRRAIDKGIVKRKDLYIQTTFAPPEGQNLSSIPNSEKGEVISNQVLKQLPYPLSAPISEQIHASIASSLRNLKTSDDEDDTYIDCLILHSPYPTRVETKEAWDILSTYVPHPIRSLGIASRELKDIGEKHFLRKEQQQGLVLNEHESKREIKAIAPSVYLNRFKKHNRKDVGLDLYHYPKKDMIFQSVWSTNDMPEIAHNALTFEICCIFYDLGYDQREMRKLAVHALLLSLKLHGLVILDGSADAKMMKRDMKTLKKLENWMKTERGKLRWRKVERAARCFLRGGKAEREEKLEAEDPEAELQGDESSLHDWNIDEVAESARKYGDPIPVRPGSNPNAHSHPTIRRTTLCTEENGDSVGIGSPFPQPSPYRTRHLTITSQLSPSSSEPSTTPKTPRPRLPKETSASRHSRNKRIIDELIKAGCSPTHVARVVEEQRRQGSLLRREKKLKGQLNTHRRDRERDNGSSVEEMRKGKLVERSYSGKGRRAGLEGARYEREGWVWTGIEGWVKTENRKGGRRERGEGKGIGE